MTTRWGGTCPSCKYKHELTSETATKNPYPVGKRCAVCGEDFVFFICERGRIGELLGHPVIVDRTTRRVYFSIHAECSIDHPYIQGTALERVARDVIDKGFPLDPASIP